MECSPLLHNCMWCWINIIIQAGCCGMLSLNLLSGQISIFAVTNNTALWNSLSINTAHCSSSPRRLLMTPVALICPLKDVRVSLSVVILSPRTPLWSNFSLPSSLMQGFLLHQSCSALINFAFLLLCCAELLMFKNFTLSSIRFVRNPFWLIYKSIANSLCIPIGFMHEDANLNVLCERKTKL